MTVAALSFPCGRPLAATRLIRRLMHRTACDFAAGGAGPVPQVLLLTGSAAIIGAVGSLGFESYESLWACVRALTDMRKLSPMSRRHPRHQVLTIHPGLTAPTEWPEVYKRRTPEVMSLCRLRISWRLGDESGRSCRARFVGWSIGSPWQPKRTERPRRALSRCQFGVSKCWCWCDLRYTSDCHIRRAESR